jgi:hypothetical protein
MAGALFQVRPITVFVFARRTKLPQTDHRKTCTRSRPNFSLSSEERAGGEVEDRPIIWSAPGPSRMMEVALLPAEA